jgi:quinol monooxygenase YgiN
MKTFIAAAFIGAASAAAIPIPDIESLTTVQYNEMLAGAVYGVLQQKGETALEACMVDGEDEAKLVFAVYKDMRAGDMVKATKAMAKVVEALPTLRLACEYQTVAANIADMEAWATFFERPEATVEADIKKNCLRHSIALTRDLHQAENLWTAGEYFKFGEEVGIMAVIATQ